MKYTVYFETKGGDYDKEWVNASSEAEAVDIIKHEHWNIKRIQHVSKG